MVRKTANFSLERCKGMQILQIAKNAEKLRLRLLTEASLQPRTGPVKLAAGLRVFTGARTDAGPRLHDLEAEEERTVAGAHAEDLEELTGYANQDTVHLRLPPTNLIPGDKSNLQYHTISYHFRTLSHVLSDQKSDVMFRIEFSYIQNSVIH